MLIIYRSSKFHSGGISLQSSPDNASLKEETTIIITAARLLHTLKEWQKFIATEKLYQNVTAPSQA